MEVEEQRLILARQFYYTYIFATDEQDSIDAIAELLSYGGDLDLIRDRMALPRETPPVQP